MRAQGRSREGGFRDARRQVDELLAAAERGRPASVYLFYGEDDHQRQEAVHKLVERLVPESEHDTRVRQLDGAAGARAVAAELESSGFRFDDEPRRVVLVRDAPFLAAGGDDAEVLRKRIEAGLLDEVVLILDVRGSVDKRMGFTKTVLAAATVVEFRALADAGDVAAFARERLEPVGLEITREAVEELVARCGTDSNRLTNELDKLAAYVGRRSVIEADDVRDLVAATAELNVFDLVDATAERRPGAAISQLEGLLRQQAEPFMILAMLIRQFRLLLQARYLLDAGLADSRLVRMRPYDFNQRLTAKQDGVSLLDEWKSACAGVLPADGKQSLLTQHYYPLWKSLNVAQRLDSPVIEAALERLLQTDLALKSSHLEPRQELELLVVDLCTRMAAGATVPYDTILDT